MKLTVYALVACLLVVAHVQARQSAEEWVTPEFLEEGLGEGEGAAATPGAEGGKATPKPGTLPGKSQGPSTKPPPGEALFQPKPIGGTPYPNYQNVYRSTYFYNPWLHPATGEAPNYHMHSNFPPFTFPGPHPMYNFGPVFPYGASPYLNQYPQAMPYFNPNVLYSPPPFASDTMHGSHGALQSNNAAAPAAAPAAPAAAPAAA